MSVSYLQTVRSMVSQFGPISLDEMDAVKLMDRIDMKFILPFEQFTGISAATGTKLQSTYN